MFLTEYIFSTTNKACYKQGFLEDPFSGWWGHIIVGKKKIMIYSKAISVVNNTCKVSCLDGYCILSVNITEPPAQYVKQQTLPITMWLPSRWWIWRTSPRRNSSSQKLRYVPHHHKLTNEMFAAKNMSIRISENLFTFMYSELLKICTLISF